MEPGALQIFPHLSFKMTFQVVLVYKTTKVQRKKNG